LSSDFWENLKIFSKNFFVKNFHEMLISHKNRSRGDRQGSAKNHPMNEWLFVGGTLSVSGG
jgi:hypothetical protein